MFKKKTKFYCLKYLDLESRPRYLMEKKIFDCLTNIQINHLQMYEFFGSVMIHKWDDQLETKRGW